MRNYLSEYSTPQNDWEWSKEKVEDDHKYRLELFENKILNCIEIHDCDYELINFLWIQEQFANKDRKKSKKFIMWSCKLGMYLDIDGNEISMKEAIQKINKLYPPRAYNWTHRP